MHVYLDVEGDSHHEDFDVGRVERSKACHRVALQGRSREGAEMVSTNQVLSFSRKDHEVTCTLLL